LGEALPSKLPKAGKCDTKTAIEILENLNDLELTDTILSKNIDVVANIYCITKFDKEFGSEEFKEEDEMPYSDLLKTSPVQVWSLHLFLPI
jgi:hypothetical protein